MLQPKQFRIVLSIKHLLPIWFPEISLVEVRRASAREKRSQRGYERLGDEILVAEVCSPVCVDPGSDRLS